MAEGNSGKTSMTFTVVASRPVPAPIVLCAATLGLTASAGSDFEPLIRCTVLGTGQTSATFTVSVRGDRKREGNETLALVVGSVPGQWQGDPIAIGTILNDD
ncbi:hypothetical protein Prum_047450 [Phytohabitans rumicis]|uniref:Uncharacterized protein n=1 Tax=Phytohabitans rumicis TaxID=1076125 RepID=A0A6V8L1E8_9ACTN|nr:hypothetical protein Prum_047450 [Phytohabitans rumicis]